MTISAEDLRPEFFCLAAPADIPHIAAYPYADTGHPSMATSQCVTCRQDIYIGKDRFGHPQGTPFALRLIIHEEDEL